jgi:hypothetical protein
MEAFLRKALWMLLLGTVLGLCATPASAQNLRAWGFCEVGGQQAVVSGLPAAPNVQASYPQCTVAVYLTGTLTLATIYSDTSNTPLANPFTANTNGYFFFYALNGRYDITLSGAGFPSPFTIGDYDLGVGGAASVVPPLPVNGILYNNATILGTAAGISTPDGNNLFIKGPAPWTDVTAFGARAVNGPSQATASYTSGNTTVTLSVGAVLNGNGVTIQGAGATVTIGTPTAPTVVPQYANSPTRDHFLTNGKPAGSASTYIYCVVAEDRGQGLTPCSASTTITTGPASLGEQSVNISSESLSNDTLTVNTSSGTFVASMMVDVLSGVPRFTGPMRTTTGGAGIFTVTNYVYDSRLAPTNSADVPNSTSAAGTVVFYQANTINITAVSNARRYWICAQRPGDGSLHVIGQTDMSYSSTGWQGTQFEDYGSTYLASQSFPYYVTDAICTGAGQPDALTTTVVSGGGTGSIVVANAPSQTDNTSTKKAILDNGPAFIAAANQAGNGTGCIYIPPSSSTLNTYAINSLTRLASGICIIQSGGIQLNDTFELLNAHWVGWNQGGVPAFGFTKGATVTAGTGNPAVHLTGTGDDISNVTFFSSVNATTAIVVDNSTSILTTVNCQLASVSDFLGICVQYRNTSTTIDQHKILGGSSFTSNLPQVSDTSWTPIIDLPFGQNGSGTGVGSGSKLDVDHFSGNRRGIAFTGGGFSVMLNHYYVQGNITPQITFISTGGGNAAIDFTDVLCDTSGQAALANLGSGSNVQFHGDVGCSATNPIISGTRPASFLSDGYFYSGLANPPGRWAQNCAVNKAISGVYESTGVGLAQQVCYYGNLLAMLGGYPIYWPLPAPATPTLTGPTAGGSMPAGTFVYAVSATGFDGGETIPSPIPSATITTSGTCPGSGNCTATVNWVAVVGAKSYNIWRCATACTGSGLPFLGGSNWLEVGLHQTGTSFNDTINAPTNNNFAQQTGTGVSQVDAAEHIAPQFVSPETTAPSGVAGFDISYADSTLHQWLDINNNGTAQARAGFTITPVSTNCVNWSGTTGLLGQVTGKCATYTITPTVGDCVTWAAGPVLGDAGAACGAGAGGMNTNMNNMANPTSLSQSLTPGAVNTVAAGTAPLPFTNIFLGTVANQSGSFNTANLTANRTMNIPDATSTLVRDCPVTVNQFMQAEAIATGTCTKSLINATASSVPSYVADSGAADVYVATLSPAIVAYAAGLTVRFLPANANLTTTPTLNVNGLGAITITKFGQAALQASDLITTAVAEVVYDGTDFELQNPATFSTALTASSVNTLTNKTINCESTGNNCSEPVKAFFRAAGCSGGSSAAPGIDTGTVNAPTSQCTGSTVFKATLQFTRGNVAYINWHLPPDWNSSASTDIEFGMTSTDTTNGHVVALNLQTGCSGVTGAATDDPALNAAQTASFTIGASQVSGGAFTFKKTALTMTSCAADSFFEIQITRDNSGTDTATNALTAAALKFAEITVGVTKNAANR